MVKCLSLLSVAMPVNVTFAQDLPRVQMCLFELSLLTRQI